MPILIHIALALAYLLFIRLPKDRLRFALPLLWFVHGGTLFYSVFAQATLWLGFAWMLSIALWISIAVFWVESKSLEIDSLRILVFPLSAIAVLLSAFFPGHPLTLHTISNSLLFHIVMASAAYSVLTVAFLHVLLMYFQYALLHRHSNNRFNSLTRLVKHIPPLLVMEKLLFDTLWLGFILLSATVFSGIVFSEYIFGHALRFDHKNVFTLFSWSILVILLAGKYFYGWRGKIALHLSFLTFINLLLAYVGSRFVLEIILKRLY